MIAKNTPREKPPRCVRCALLPARRLCSQPTLLAARSLAPVRTRSRHAARGALVDTSVYLKPAELFNVALDMLAGLAPCLNLSVREFGHKDLLDTIGADNRRK